MLNVVQFSKLQGIHFSWLASLDMRTWSYLYHQPAPLNILVYNFLLHPYTSGRSLLR